ncbi:S-layer homology domain-containing protein [Solibacillus sp. FSL R7-0682]|uniref:S-layer homology domain-containing protein n=1 Tax=Solibacillus sp. FSL R7-0682 TaxID=2921690 RepID=UPI0030F69353
MAKTNKGRKLFATTATAALVASAIVPVASAAQINDFNTISSYAQEAVQDLVDRGVIQGDEKGNFNPRKSVTRAEAATILVNALELESTGSINFTDVKAGAWYYDAINAAVNNGIFQGQGAGKFNPSGNLTRSEAAIILVDAFGLEGSASLSQFSDSASVKAWAQEALEIAVANGVIKGDNGKLNPNAPITRQDFAVMYSRTEGVEAPVSGAIKAINNTTVEVTFEEPVTDLASLDFKIEGLEITGKVVKQTDNTTVVLTTAAQTAGTTYTLSLDGEEVGKFTGVASVIPTAVKTVVASQQGVIGKEVTLTAEVTVAEGQSKAGIPVTFNIVNDKSTNAKIEVEALTNDKGVATYSYTRYYNGIDEVVAYATSKSSVKDNARVYWANAAQLTIKEAKEDKSVANGSKKTYEITGAKNSVVFVTFEENLGVKSNKVADGVVVTSAVGSVDEKGNYTPYTGSKGLTPYELSTGAAQYVAIELDKNGKGSLILTGSDDSVTPIVYEATIGDLDTDKLDKAQDKVKKLNPAYGKLLLQDKAATVKFEQNDKLELAVKALGTEDAAEAGVLPAAGTEIDEENDFGYGGREYEVTVKTKTGELADAGTTAYVTFPKFDGASQVIIDGKVYDIKKDGVYAIKVAGKEGKASFRVIGKGKKSYVTPTVFLNTDGKTGADTALDKKDIQVEAETTYFTEAEVKEAVIKVLNAEFGAEVASLQAGKTAYAVYQSVDQNGFAYGTGKKYDVTFELSTTFGELKVQGGTKNVGRTYTFETTSDANGRAVVEFTADSATTVEIDILGSRNVLPSKAATVKFTQFATGETTGVVASKNTANDTLTIGTNVYSYADAKEYQEKGSKISKAAFETLLSNEYVRVAVTKDADGKLTFNVLEAGAAPVVPPVAGGLISKAEVTSPTTIVVTFSEAVTFADDSQFWFDLDKDGVVDANETTLTSAGTPSSATHTFTVAAGTTITSDIGKVVYTPALASADRLTKTTGSIVVSETITLDDAKTTLVAATNPLVLVAATGTTATPSLGTAGTEQVEELTLTAAAGLGDGTFTAQFAATGVTVAPITITTVLNESLPSVASRLVTALNSDTNFNAKYVASTSGAKVVISAKTAAAEDTALNLSIAEVNSGISPVATSTLVGTPAAGTSAIATANVSTPALEATAFNKVAKVRVAQTSTTLGNFDKTIEVPVTGVVTAAQTATAIVNALNADTTFNARFTATVDTTVNTAVVVTNKETGVVTATVIEVAN